MQAKTFEEWTHKVESLNHTQPDSRLNNLAGGRFRWQALSNGVALRFDYLCKCQDQVARYPELPSECEVRRGN